ncbi:MAG: helix-turn-helix transcriptional regulator [Cyclobacteriaceae bacterium]|nr:helix-turn-helix transcriptional regulator [Cyclobacteriaceae bacterium]
MHIGNSIKTIRLARGYSQEQLSNKSGLAQNVISRIERDMHKPTDETLRSLSLALDVDPDVFYYLSIIESVEDTKLNSLKAEIAPLIIKEIKEIYSLD